MSAAENSLNFGGYLANFLRLYKPPKIILANFRWLLAYRFSHMHFIQIFTYISIIQRKQIFPHLHIFTYALHTDFHRYINYSSKVFISIQFKTHSYKH